MRYVMVPVPTEHVLDVMRWVLFRAPEEDPSAMKDAASLRTLWEEGDDLTRGILHLVADATANDVPLRLTEAADQLDQDAGAVRAALRRLNATALAGGRSLVRVSEEIAVGIEGNRGRIAFLTMRPEHARLMRTTMKTSHVSQTALPSDA